MYSTISYHGGVLTGGVDLTGLSGVIYLKRSMKGNFGMWNHILSKETVHRFNPKKPHGTIPSPTSREIDADDEGTLSYWGKRSIPLKVEGLEGRY